MFTRRRRVSGSRAKLVTLEAPGRSLCARLAHRPGGAECGRFDRAGPVLDCDGSIRIDGAASRAPSGASGHLLGSRIARSVPGSPFRGGPCHQAIEQLAPASNEGDRKLARGGERLLERGVERRFDSNDCAAVIRSGRSTNRPEASVTARALTARSPSAPGKLFTMIETSAPWSEWLSCASKTRPLQPSSPLRSRTTCIACASAGFVGVRTLGGFAPQPPDI